MQTGPCWSHTLTSCLPAAHCQLHSRLTRVAYRCVEVIIQRCISTSLPCDASHLLLQALGWLPVPFTKPQQRQMQLRPLSVPALLHR